MGGTGDCVNLWSDNCSSIAAEVINYNFVRICEHLQLKSVNWTPTHCCEFGTIDLYGFRQEVSWSREFFTSGLFPHLREDLASLV